MCFARRRTSGAHTAATIVAVTTGMTIVFVSASSVTAATISAAMPTSSHASTPKSRSQLGAAKTPDSSPGSRSTK